MASTIQNGLTAAWLQGAALGARIDWDELTDEEKTELRQAIRDEYNYIPKLAADIWNSDRIAGGLLRPFLNRADLWQNRFRDIRNRAKLMAAGDPKLKWVLGPTEKSCEDCSKYDGRVYRASTWDKYDIQPQSRRLACHGHKCECDLVVTDEPLTRGFPPRPKY